MGYAAVNYIYREVGGGRGGAYAKQKAKERATSMRKPRREQDHVEQVGGCCSGGRVGGGVVVWGTRKWGARAKRKAMKLKDRATSMRKPRREQDPVEQVGGCCTGGWEAE